MSNCFNLFLIRSSQLLKFDYCTKLNSYVFSSSKLETEKSSVVNVDDLKHLHNLVEEKDGGPAWIQMMDRSTPNMSYQAWRRDPEVESFS